MDIGISDKPYVSVLEDESKSHIIIEDDKHGTYTLYEIEETLMHPSPGLADEYAEKPYTFDALTGVMRIYRLVGTCQQTVAALEHLLGEATQV